MAVFLDTDIGSDVDDSLALIYAAKNLPLKGVTTVHGVSQLRAKIASYILRQLEKDIPVHSGISYPLDSETLYVYGYEGNGYPLQSEPKPKNYAVSFLETMLQKGDSIISIGPLTNIAALLNRSSSLKERIAGIYLQASVVEKNGQWKLNRLKHNVRVDPYAADVVIESGIPLYILPTETAKQVWLTKEDFASLPKTPLFDAVRQNAADYLNMRDQQNAFLYDPLTIMLYAHPKLFQLEKKGNITIAQEVNEKEAKTCILKALREEMVKCS